MRESTVLLRGARTGSRGHSVADSSASRRRNDKNDTVGVRGRAVPGVKG